MNETFLTQFNIWGIGKSFVALRDRFKSELINILSISQEIKPLFSSSWINSWYQQNECSIRWSVLDFIYMSLYFQWNRTKIFICKIWYGPSVFTGKLISVLFDLVETFRNEKFWAWSVWLFIMFIFVFLSDIRQISVLLQNKEVFERTFLLKYFCHNSVIS